LIDFTHDFFLIAAGTIPYYFLVLAGVGERRHFWANGGKTRLVPMRARQGLPWWKLVWNLLLECTDVCAQWVLAESAPRMRIYNFYEVDSRQPTLPATCQNNCGLFHFNADKGITTMKTPSGLPAWQWQSNPRSFKTSLGPKTVDISFSLRYRR
jgi:hypothetical protein